MNSIGLQAVSAALFVVWISILAAMGKAKIYRSASPDPAANSAPGDPMQEESAVPEDSGEAEPVVHVPAYPAEAELAEFENSVKEELSAPAPAYSFSRWEELLAVEDAAVSVICRNPRWSEAPEACEDFARRCREKGIALVDREDSEQWLSKRATVHFDDCRLMPLLWAENYRVHRVRGRSLLELLREASPFSILVLSVKDDGSQALNHDWQEKLCEVGLRSLTREHLRCSYINIIWKKFENTYISLYEERSEGPLAKRYDPGDFINDFKFPISLEVASEGFYAGNSSSIKIDGREYSPNQRGMNIVAYDMVDSKVEGVHRVDTFVSVYEDTAVYVAVPEEGEKDAS